MSDTPEYESQFTSETFGTLLQKYGAKLGIPLDTPSSDLEAVALIKAELLEDNIKNTKDLNEKVEYTKGEIYTSHFCFNSSDTPVEMLRIAKDGFYVRGVRLEQDADEARKVFDAFTEWMRSTGAKI